MDLNRINEISKTVHEHLNDLSFIISIIPIGRNYNSITKINSVNDIDILIIVERKADYITGVLLRLVGTVISKYSNAKNTFITGNIDAPYKPSKVIEKKIFFYHLIIEDNLSINLKKNFSYPTLFSWAKYPAIKGGNPCKEIIKRSLITKDVLKSKFGIINTFQMIEEKRYITTYFDLEKGEYSTKVIEFDEWYFAYFLYYCTMQSIRNLLRLKKTDIAFLDDYSVLNLILIQKKDLPTNVAKDLIDIRNEDYTKPFNLESLANETKVLLKELKKMAIKDYNNGYNQLDVEEYKMTAAYILELQKKNDFYIKLNITAFMAGLTLIITKPSLASNSKFLLILLVFINYNSYKYFTANNKLLISFQAFLANTYEQVMNFGWYKTSKVLRDQFDQGKDEEYFSPVKFFHVLISISAIIYFLIYGFEIFQTENYFHFDSSKNLDIVKIFNAIISVVFLFYTCCKLKEINKYESWPKRFNQRDEDFKKLNNGKL
jgi:hypothetical protein